MKIYTIGFTKRSAEEFFEILKRNKIQQLIDTRLNNTSQLAGFTKRGDIEYFLKELCGIDYYYFEFLAPTKEIRDRYIKEKNWDVYTNGYVNLLEERRVLEKLDRAFFERETCLLCSESLPVNCHRRLLAEYLKKHWDNVEVIHL